MFGSYLVELVLGLSFLFAVLGIVTTAVTEVCLSVLKTRSKHLKEWLEQWSSQLLIENRAAGSATFSLATLKAHPLIASHHRHGDCSFLPADQLASAFLQILAMPFGTTCVGQNLQSAEQGLRRHINTLQSDALKSALNALLNSAVSKATDGTTLIAKLKEEATEWIDASMGRVEGWTKRHAKKFSLAAALFICVAFNVSALEVLRVLSTDSKVREQMATAAVGYVEKKCIETESATTEETVPNKPVAPPAPSPAEPSAPISAPTTLAAPAPANNSMVAPSKRSNAAQLQDDAAKAVTKSVQCLREQAEHVVGALGPLSRLGIGWDKPPRFWSAKGGAWALEFIGWVVGVIFAAFAASLGGDFWLKWIGEIVRLTGYKPKAVIEEAKK